jgi:hypothetical protein
MGEECYHSFLNETFLVDQTKTNHIYMQDNPNIMEANALPKLGDR